MEDVGRSPPPISSIAVADSGNINELDAWIGTLMQCKQLSEMDVQRLCEKVRSISSSLRATPSTLKLPANCC